jgi:hypothetical protein
VRGEAYLMFHDGNRAAAEFQKFIDRRGVVMNSLGGRWLATVCKGMNLG